MTLTFDEKENMKSTFTLLCLLLLVGCTTSKPYDYLDFDDYSISGNELYIFARRKKGTVTTRFGPDPSCRHVCKQFQLYRLTYSLDPALKDTTLKPKIESILDVEVNGHPDYYDMTSYLPSNAFQSGEYETNGIAWAYTDTDAPLRDSAKALLSATAISGAKEDGIILDQTRRVFQSKRETILICTAKDQAGGYIPPFVLYCVETKQKYQLEPTVSSLSLEPMYSEKGSVIFSTTHSSENAHDKNEAILEWNPRTGEVSQWFIGLPHKNELSKK